MPRRLPVFLLSALGLNAIAQTPPPRGLFLGEATTPVSLIYHADQPIARTAAAELTECLQRIFRQDFTAQEIKTAAELPSDGPAIVVGASLVPEPLRRKSSGAEDREWLARTVTADGRMYLWGNDAGTFTGTCWAAEDFLSRDCGARWLWPGPLGEVLPQRDTLRLPVGELTDAPVFAIRDPSFGYRLKARNENDDLAVWRRRQRFGRSVFGYRGTSGFNHYFPFYIPNQDFAAHPEYFSLVSPQNWIGPDKPAVPTRQTGQLCTSNPEVRRLFAQKIAATDSAHIMPISPNDGYLFCECAACKAEDTIPWDNAFGRVDLTDRIFAFVRAVATQAKELNPRAKIGIFSYSFFSGIPKDLRPLPDNVYISATYSCGELATEAARQGLRDRLQAFARLGAKFVGREYWGTHYYCSLPWLHTRAIAENIRLLHENGAIGLYGEGGKDFANNALNYYLLAALMWNPERSREDIVNDFCTAAFGPAAETMSEYFELLENTTQTWARRQLEAGKSIDYADKFNGFAVMFSPELLASARRLLQQAERGADDARQRERVQFFRDGLLYAEIFAAMVRSYQQAAGLGVPLVFTFPASEHTVLDDKLIVDVLQAAVKAGEARERRLCELQGSNALDLGLMMYGNRPELRPWHRVAQDHLLAARKGLFNYLVNGAFEFGDFAWDLAPDVMSITRHDNHDDIHNGMANYHAGQGCSLLTRLPAGQGAAATSRVAVRAMPGTGWVFSGWVKNPSGLILQPTLAWEHDGQTGACALPELPNGFVDAKGWREFLFAPADLPHAANGTFRLQLEISNPTGQEASIWLDDLKLKKKQ